MTDAAGELDPALTRVADILDRVARLDALPALAHAIQFALPQSALDKSVIALDANVILRLSNHARGADIVDYLRTDFPGRLILPGQVIQEFWNNQFLAVSTKATEIKRKFSELSDLIGSIDARFESFSGRFTAILDDFNEDFGYVFDDRTVGKTKLLIELLQEKAVVPFVPRTMLSSAAAVRKRT